MSNFLKKILAATGLTRRGHLVEATATLQRALADHVAATMPSAPATDPAAMKTIAPTKPGGPLDDDVLDGLVHEVRSGAATTVDRPSRFAESSFTGATGTRLFKLFEPAGFTGPLPMVVMLHGCTQDPDDFATGTRMNLLAQELGWFVLYPAQAPRSNANKCWNWFVPDDQRRGHGEPALIAGMTRHVMETHPVDADRVFVAGLSAGGAMAAILAREYPDLYAAAGIHSGLAAGSAHDVGSAFAAMKTGVARATLPPRWPGRPAVEADATEGANAGAPVIVFHGDADPTVNVVNASLLLDAALGASGSWQATRQSGTSEQGRGYTRTTYRAENASGAAPSRAEHWLVHGGGHAWFGGDKRGSYADAAGPDASREMLRFFAEHGLSRR